MISLLGIQDKILLELNNLHKEYKASGSDEEKVEVLTEIACTSLNVLCTLVDDFGVEIKAEFSPHINYAAGILHKIYAMEDVELSFLEGLQDILVYSVFQAHLLGEDVEAFLSFVSEYTQGSDDKVIIH